MKGFLNPEKVLKEIKLKKDLIAADFGSGSGGWAIPLAKRLENGKVYALDILKEPLLALKSKADLEKVANIETICSDLEKKGGSTLADSSVDLVLMTNLLFQLEDKKEVFAEAKRILKKEGEILVVDWKPGAISFGPPAKERVSEKEIKKMAKEFGLKLEKEFEASQYHWALIFKKP